MQVQTTKNYRLVYRVHCKGCVAEVLCNTDHWKVRKTANGIVEKVTYMKNRPTLNQIKEI